MIALPRFLVVLAGALLLALGLASLRVEHGGAAYLFATPGNRDAFKADPARYLPQYGGY